MRKILIVDIDENLLRREWDKGGNESLNELIEKEMKISQDYGIWLKSIEDDNILYPEQQL